MLAISDNAHFEYSNLAEWGHYITLKHFSFSFTTVIQRKSAGGVIGCSHSTADEDACVLVDQKT